MPHTSLVNTHSTYNRAASLACYADLDEFYEVMGMVRSWMDGRTSQTIARVYFGLVRESSISGRFQYMADSALLSGPTAWAPGQPDNQGGNEACVEAVFPFKVRSEIDLKLPALRCTLSLQGTSNWYVIITANCCLDAFAG